MKNKFLVLFMLLLRFGITASQAQTPAIGLTDINLLKGEWKGTLTYLDYTTQKPYTMPADVRIQHLPKSHQLVFLNSYPNEPKANGADTVTLLQKGQMLDKEKVKSKKMLPGGDTEIVTEYMGVDGNNNNEALVRHTYIFGKTSFIKKKEVQFKGENEWIKRHEYSYVRASPSP